MVKNFRVDKATFQFLCETLSVELSPHPIQVRNPISVEMKVGISLCNLKQFGVHKSLREGAYISFVQHL